MRPNPTLFPDGKIYPLVNFHHPHLQENPFPHRVPPSPTFSPIETTENGTPPHTTSRETNPSPKSKRRPKKTVNPPIAAELVQYASRTGPVCRADRGQSQRGAAVGGRRGDGQRIEETTEIIAIAETQREGITSARERGARTEETRSTRTFAFET